jgi:hypothetical protein
VNFDHVENTTLKTLLENGWDGDEDSICTALAYSAVCVAEDEQNELLDERIVCARSMEMEWAEIAWNEEGDGFGAVEHLQKLWQI